MACGRNSPWCFRCAVTILLFSSSAWPRRRRRRALRSSVHSVTRVQSLASSLRFVRWQWHLRRDVSPPASRLSHISPELGEAHETCELQSGTAAHIKSLSRLAPSPFRSHQPKQPNTYLSSSLHRPSRPSPSSRVLSPSSSRTLHPQISTLKGKHRNGFSAELKGLNQNNKQHCSQSLHTVGLTVCVVLIILEGEVK